MLKVLLFTMDIDIDDQSHIKTAPYYNSMRKPYIERMYTGIKIVFKLVYVI